MENDLKELNKIKNITNMNNNADSNSISTSNKTNENDPNLTANLNTNFILSKEAKNRNLILALKEKSEDNIFLDYISFTNYNGIQIVVQKQNINSKDIFDIDKLDKSLDFLLNYVKIMNSSCKIDEIITSINVNISGELGAWIPIFLKQSFTIHSTFNNNIFLNLWTDPNRESKIPSAPFTDIGIGAIIVNKNFEFLLIKENKVRLDNLQWKFVTGLVDFGENIFDATLREIEEEISLSGNELEFLGNLYYRFLTGVQGIKMDICFFNVVYYSKDEYKIDELKLCKDEVSQVKVFKENELRKLIIENPDLFTFTTVAVFKHLFEIIDKLKENNSLKMNKNKNNEDIMKDNINISNFTNNNENIDELRNEDKLKEIYKHLTSESVYKLPSKNYKGGYSTIMKKNEFKF